MNRTAVLSYKKAPVRQTTRLPLGSAIFTALLLVAALLGSSQPVQADSVLNFPRLSFERNTSTGIAFVNPSAQNALITVTAYGADGKVLAAGGFQNPVQISLAANQQIARLLSEVFGGTLPSSSVGWFQATSPVDGLTGGFFLYLDDSGTFLDGADLPPSAAKIVFNQVGLAGYITELNLINPGSNSANVQLQLISAGSSPTSRSLTIPAKGISRLDAASFFGNTNVALGAYITATADTDIAGFEFVGSPASDLVGLNARSASEQLRSLFFPQMAVLGRWKTELGLVNYSTSPVILTIFAYKPDGTLYETSNLKNNPVTRSLEPGAGLREDVASLFGFNGSSPLDGWIKVESTSAAVNGYISYGTGNSLATVSAAPLGLKRAIFSHIATSAGYFTGVAVLNPGSLSANVRILAIQRNGQVLGSYDIVLQPGFRLSQLIRINELIPEAAGQGGGLIWIKSDQPVYLTELFGTNKTLANVPAQPAPDSYNPDTAFLTLKMNPPLAAVHVGSSQNFQVRNGTGNFRWLVNDAEGGNATVGTISAAGVYRAPAAVPVPQVLTVTAINAARQLVGASVDILRKEPLVSNLGVVQSVAYLGSLKKLYVAELTTVSASRPAPAQAPTSSISEVSPGGPKISLASYTNESISKMIPFTASDGKEYLLLAGQTGGRIIRLNPNTKESRDIGPVIFADPKLEDAVRSALKIDATASITCDKVKSLTSFSACGRGIRLLNGLESFINLQSICLESNSISDLRPLSSLVGLKDLNLNENSISDVAPLSGLTGLTSLTLLGNSIKDVRPLSGLALLTKLDLHRNSVGDVTPLSTLTRLTFLAVSYNPIGGKISPISGLTGLTDLHLENTALTDITPLAGLTGLNLLHLDTNALSEIRTLSKLTRLKEIRLPENKIGDITPLSALKALAILYLYSNQISNLTPLSGLTALQELELENNLINDIRPLVANSGLGNGDRIDLTNNNLSLTNCPDLKALTARGASVKFSPQAGQQILTCP